MNVDLHHLRQGKYTPLAALIAGAAPKVHATSKRPHGWATNVPVEKRRHDYEVAQAKADAAFERVIAAIKADPTAKNIGALRAVAAMARAKAAKLQALLPLA